MVRSVPPEETHRIPPARFTLVTQHDDALGSVPVALLYLILHLLHTPRDNGQGREAIFLRRFAAIVDEVAVPDVNPNELL